jgi:hypothetical protein
VAASKKLSKVAEKLADTKYQILLVSLFFFSKKLRTRVYKIKNIGWRNHLFRWQTASNCFEMHFRCFYVGSRLRSTNWRTALLLWALKINAFVTQSARSSMGGKKQKKNDKNYTLRGRHRGDQVL